MPSGPETQQKMQVVVKSLVDNPAVVVIGGVEKLALAADISDGLDQRLFRTLDVYTHPAEPDYDTDRLNEFMADMVRSRTDGDLRFYLHYCWRARSWPIVI